MISGIGRSGDDLGINLLNNMIKDITDVQSNLTEKLLKISVTEQVEASQAGVGEVVDELA
jgi:hypothetical protein